MSESKPNPCEGESRELFESISGLDDEAAKEAARICAQCAVAAECRDQLTDDEYHEYFMLPTVISGVYISPTGKKQVVDTTPEAETRFRGNREIHYGEYIDNEDPHKVVTGLRQLLREGRIAIDGGSEEARAKKLLGIDHEPLTPEEYVALRHYKTLARARSKGFLLEEVPAMFKKTVDSALEDYKEITKIANPEAAAAVVAHCSPEDLADFFQLVEEDTEITQTHINDFLYRNRKNPSEGLQRYRRNIQLVYDTLGDTAEGAELYPYNIKRLVLDNPRDPLQAVNDCMDRVKQLRTRVRNPRAVQPHVLNYLAAGWPKTYPQALYRFETIFENLADRFGNTELDETTIRSIALNHPYNAHEQAGAVLRCQTELSKRYGNRDGVTGGIIRRFSCRYIDPEAAMEQYLANIDYIQQTYPRFPERAVYYIAMRLKSSKVIASRVAGAYDQLASAYDGRPECTDYVMWHIASRYFDSPEQTMSTYLQNLNYLREKYSRYQINEDYLQEAAIYNLSNPDKSMRRLLRFMGVVANRSGEASLNKPVGEDAELIDFVKGNISAEDDYFQQLHRSGVTQKVDAILQRLGPRQQRALELYYGFMEPEETEEMPKQKEIDQIISTIRERSPSFLR